MTEKIDLSNVDKHLKGFLEYRKSALGQVANDREISIAKDMEFLSNKSAFKNIENDELEYLIYKYFSVPRGMGQMGYLKSDYYVRDLLKATSITVFKSELFMLLHGKKELSIRWDKFMSKVRMIDTYNTSMLLGFTFPDKYCIWSLKLFYALDKLKPFSSDRIDKLRNHYSKVSGKDYLLILSFMNSLRNYLQKSNLKIRNYLDVNTYIHFLSPKGG